MDSYFIKSLVDKGLSQREIAAIIGKSHASVERWLKKNDLKTNAKSGPKSHRPVKTCQRCGKKTRPDNKRFCSYECDIKSRWERTKKRIEEEGKITSVVTARRYVREQQLNKCKICNLNSWFGGKLPLILDHIDGNSDNWYLENLRMVCSNCDSLLPTYKGRNAGNGRYARRKRYQDGKSY